MKRRRNVASTRPRPPRRTGSLRFHHGVRGCAEEHLVYSPPDTGIYPCIALSMQIKPVSARGLLWGGVGWRWAAVPAPAAKRSIIRRLRCNTLLLMRIIDCTARTNSWRTSRGIGTCSGSRQRCNAVRSFSTQLRRAFKLWSIQLASCKILRASIIRPIITALIQLPSARRSRFSRDFIPILVSHLSKLQVTLQVNSVVTSN